MADERTLVFTEARGCLILLHAKQSPSEQDWDKYVEAAKNYSHNTDTPRILIVTDGGAPSPGQRTRLDKTAGPPYHDSKIAVVTGSTFARGIVMAIQRVRPKMQAFAPERMDEALRYLDIAPSDIEGITGQLETLRHQLGRSSPDSAR